MTEAICGGGHRAFLRRQVRGTLATVPSTQPARNAPRPRRPQAEWLSERGGLPPGAACLRPRRGDSGSLSPLPGVPEQPEGPQRGTQGTQPPPLISINDVPPELGLTGPLAGRRRTTEEAASLL